MVSSWVTQPSLFQVYFITELKLFAVNVEKDMITLFNPMNSLAVNLEMVIVTNVNDISYQYNHCSVYLSPMRRNSKHSPLHIAKKIYGLCIVNQIDFVMWWYVWVCLIISSLYHYVTTYSF